MVDKVAGVEVNRRSIGAGPDASGAISRGQRRTLRTLAAFGQQHAQLVAKPEVGWRRLRAASHRSIKRAELGQNGPAQCQPAAADQPVRNPFVCSAYSVH